MFALRETRNRKGDERMSLDEQNPGLESWTRRRFVQLGVAGAASLGVMNLARAEQAIVGHSMMDVSFEKRDPRVAMIGIGGRGTSLLGNLLAADAQVVALCDIVKEKTEHGARLRKPVG
jgi:hypothetical protein